MTEMPVVAGRRRQGYQRQAEVKLAYKPGSVQGVTLGQSFLSTIGCPMAPAAYPGAARATLSLPYLALLRMGFGVPFLLPEARWALTRSRPVTACRRVPRSSAHHFTLA